MKGNFHVRFCSRVGEVTLRLRLTYFRLLRIIVIFGFLVGGIFLVNQAMQGGDWKPIGNMMAIGVGFVLAIEVLSRLVLGT